MNRQPSNERHQNHEQLYEHDRIDQRGATGQSGLRRHPLRDLHRLARAAYDIDREVARGHALVGWWLYRANPVLRRHDEEVRQAGAVAFRLGRDIERRELGLPPMHSEYFHNEPAERPTLHIV